MAPALLVRPAAVRPDDTVAIVSTFVADPFGTNSTNCDAPSLTGSPGHGRRGRRIGHCAELGGLSRLATDIQIAATRNRHRGADRRSESPPGPRERRSTNARPVGWRPGGGSGTTTER